MAVFTVHEEKRNETFGDDGVTVERLLRVRPYSARLEVVGSLLGGVRLVGRTLVRVPPARDPQLPFCFCMGVRSEGIGSILGSSVGDANHLDNVNTYGEGALLSCTYRTLSYEAQEAGDGTGNSQNGNQTPAQELELATETYDFSTTSITLDQKRMGWDQVESPGEPPVEKLLAATNQNQAPTKVLPRLQYQLTRHYVARLQIETIKKCLGRINRAEFKVGAKRWPTETVRFDSVHAARKTTSQGVKFYDVSHRFAINPIWDVIADGEEGEKQFVGWNRVLRHDTLKWQRLVWAADPTKGIYEYDDDVTQVLGGRTWTGFELLFHPRAK